MRYVKAFVNIHYIKANTSSFCFEVNNDRTETTNLIFVLVMSMCLALNANIAEEPSEINYSLEPVVNIGD